MSEIKEIYSGQCTRGAIGFCAHGIYANWLFWKHPDGNWVTLGEIQPAPPTDEECAEALDALEGFICDLTLGGNTGQTASRLIDFSHKELPSLRKALSPPRVEKWQPIETAPRDKHVLLLRAKGAPVYDGAGKQFLGDYCPQCFVAIWYNERSFCGKPPRWVTPHEGAAPWLDSDFSHWMHLPVPPRTQHKENEDE